MAIQNKHTLARAKSIKPQANKSAKYDKGDLKNIDSIVVPNKKKDSNTVSNKGGGNIVENTTYITIEIPEELLDLDSDTLSEELLTELRFKKIVSRRGKVRKQFTAGIKGRKIVNGKVRLISGKQKQTQRLGMIARRRTMKAKSKAARRRSALFAAKGRKKRYAMGVRDTRHGQ